MLVSVCSSKGSPGTTSTALAVAAAWPQRAARLMEADPAGGDLAFRCRHASGREVATSPSLLGLATLARGRSLEGPTDPELLDQFAQPLACGVRLLPGPLSVAQARGLSGVWPHLAHVAEGSASPVVADVGRLQGTEATAIAAASTVVLVVCQPSLESVTHSQQLIQDLAPRLPAREAGRAWLPVVVSPHRRGRADAGDLDELMRSLGGLPLAPAMPMAFDPRGLRDLEAGADPTGRLANTPLMRSAAALVARLLAASSAPRAPQTAMWEMGPAR